MHIDASQRRQNPEARTQTLNDPRPYSWCKNTSVWLLPPNTLLHRKMYSQLPICRENTCAFTKSRSLMRFQAKEWLINNQLFLAVVSALKPNETMATQGWEAPLTFFNLDFNQIWRNFVSWLLHICWMLLWYDVFCTVYWSYLNVQVRRALFRQMDVLKDIMCLSTLSATAGFSGRFNFLYVPVCFREKNSLCYLVPRLGLSTGYQHEIHFL